MSNNTEAVVDAPKALLGTKLGMTQVWDEAGRLIPVTVVAVGTNVVTQVRTPEVDGYSAIQLAIGDKKPKNVTKPLQGHFAAAGTAPKRHVAEIRTSAASDFVKGQELLADVFEAGDVVDVVGTTKGKGTAGVMKRHGFAGVGASHGSHRNHRKPGSIGGASTPSRVFRGLRMAGRMGNAQRTVQNLSIVSVDTENGLLLVAGAVPGNKGGMVVVRSAKKGA